MWESEIPQNSVSATRCRATETWCECWKHWCLMYEKHMKKGKTYVSGGKNKNKLCHLAHIALIKYLYKRQMIILEGVKMRFFTRDLMFSIQHFNWRQSWTEFATAKTKQLRPSSYPSTPGCSTSARIVEWLPWKCVVASAMAGASQAPDGSLGAKMARNSVCWLGGDPWRPIPIQMIVFWMLLVHDSILLVPISAY